MSILAPLYFLGAAAIALPILFHLIRRRPKGEVVFSSLMFLQPTPPRLTKRSRLENWPLLLMRALALLLLAAAFARPFFRSEAFSDQTSVGRRLMMVIDTSASMQRTGLWDQAKQKASDVIDGLSKGDQLAIVKFDKEPQTVMSYEQSSELTMDQLKTTAHTLLSEIAPTWHSTNMGLAVRYAADMAATYEPDDAAEKNGSDSKNVSDGPANLILISDMQSGSQIENLQAYSWPKNLKLDVRRVIAKETTNAAAQILSEIATTKDGQRVRVRVGNSADAQQSRFRLAWMGGSKTSELPVQVPPGETRVVRMPIPEQGVTSLVLRDDSHSFDNQRYIVSPQPESLTLLYVGSDATLDPKTAEARDSLLFYLQRLPLDNPQRTVTVTPIQPDKLVIAPEVKTTPLVIVSQPLSTDTASRLRPYLSAGGNVLFVMSKEVDAEMLAAIQTVGRTDDVNFDDLKISEAKVNDYAMFSQIDFSHPIFQPMSDPQFNDFTKVRFWSHRSIKGLPDDSAIVAKFDNGDPAIIEHRMDQGRLWILASGWQPKSSQLALSTKFLPLMFSLFDSSSNQVQPFGSFVLGDAISYKPSSTAVITKPDETTIAWKSSTDLDQINQPGIYQFTDDGQTRSFAVNLPESESDTSPLADDALERFGVTVGKTLSVAQTQANQRQLRDVELENNQKLWQWLLAAALALLAIETLWGGLLSRSGRQPEPA
jgi:Aerotolerance regulator N-terminal/von Willebrand factor type A domain